MHTFLIPPLCHSGGGPGCPAVGSKVVLSRYIWSKAHKCTFGAQDHAFTWGYGHIPRVGRFGAKRSTFLEKTRLCRFDEPNGDFSLGKSQYSEKRFLQKYFAKKL